MDITQSSPKRIHPLTAAAAVSVIIVSLTGAAAITGILPTSKSAPDAQQPSALTAGAASNLATVAAGDAVAAPAAPQPATASTQVASNDVQPEPAPAPKKEKPAPKRTVEKTREVHHYHAAPQVARNDAPTYAQQAAPAPAPAPAPAQPAASPNYIGIGTGAIVGGLIGNQIGGGSGKKLATVAGVIGGGIVGNEIANRNKTED